MSLLLLFQNGRPTQAGGGPQLYTVSPTDTVDLRDLGILHFCTPNVFTSLLRVRGISDLDDMSDAFARLQGKVIGERQNVSDSVLTTTIIGVAFILRQIADTIELRDGFARAQSLGQTDNQATLEAFNKFLAKNIQESQTPISDAMARYILRFLSLSDREEISDSFRKLLGKAIADSAATSDTFARLLVKATGDAVDIVDLSTAIKQAIRRFLDDLQLSDSFSKLLGKRSADISQLSDLSALGLSKVFGDRQEDNDALAKALSKVIGERQDISDLANIFKLAATILLAIADSLDLRDGFNKSLSKIVGELDEQADALTKLLNKSIVEREDASDSVLIFKIVSTILLAIADSLSVSDAQRKLLSKAVAELGDLLDSQGKLLSKATTDRQDIFDSAFSARQLVRLIAESVEVSDRFAKALLKLLSDDAAAADSYVKALSKRIADDEAARDSYSSALAKSIGENQAARDLYALALVKTISDREDVSDNALLSRQIRRTLTDLEDVSDSVIRTKITTQLILEVIEQQDFRDEFLKKLFKTIAENQNVLDNATLVKILAVPIVAEYIYSMISDSRSTFGEIAGAIDAARTKLATQNPFGMQAGAPKSGQKAKAEDDKDIMQSAPGIRKKR